MRKNPPTEQMTEGPPGEGRESDRDADSASAERGDRPPTPAELHALNAALAHEFPVTIDTTELVLMDVDPTRLHAFWSMMPGDLEAVGQALDPEATAALVLRLHDVTPARFGHADRARSVDINVEGLQGNRYIEQMEPGKSYIAELGLVRPNGTLAVLAESNTALMPGIAPPMAMTRPAAVTREGPELPQPHDGPAGVGLADLEPVFPNPGEREPWKSLSLLPTGAEPDARPAQDPGVSAAHPATDGPTASVPVSEAQRTHPPPGLTGDGAPQGSWPGLTPELGSWSAFDTWSSSALAQSDADLELNVELLVYGRTRPGGRLSLFGRPVAVGPDGSFSIRQRLPDGVIPLALVLGGDNTTNDGGS